MSGPTYHEGVGYTPVEAMGRLHCMCDVCRQRSALHLEAARKHDHEGPCKLTVDAVITIQFPVTITVDKQAGEDEWDLRDRYAAELRALAESERSLWTPDVELCDARIELP